jgi:MOSC domain-containing protein YiiM
MGHIHQINISKGGVPKLPVFEAEVKFGGIAGDKQKDKRYHGGAERAICLFSLELILKLRDMGHPIFPGSTGENLTISFENYDWLVPDTKIKVGAEVVLQIASYAAPCKTIKASFKDELFACISHKFSPGQSRLYARVIKEGIVKLEDPIEIIN